MSVATFLLAGLVFSAINAIVKPVVTALSLPFVLVTIAMLPNIHMSFGWAIVSSLILSLLNYLLNSLTPIELNQERV